MNTQTPTPDLYFVARSRQASFEARLRRIGIAGGADGPNDAEEARLLRPAGAPRG
jgi:hypothetical protein